MDLGGALTPPLLCHKKDKTMATPHINAEMGDFADVVLMPGDPLRAKYIAETFLEEIGRAHV